MSDRQIHNLVVLCNNVKAGCKWHGKLNELNDHLANTCLYEKVKCPKGCTGLLLRRDVALHVKSECSKLVINCPHCLVRGEKHFIEGQHLEECSNVPLSCPNHCGVSITDETLNEHRQICSLEMVSCEYNELGCNTHMARKDIEVHNREDTAKHLSLAKQKLERSTKELESSKLQLATVVKRLDILKATFAYSIEEVLSMIRLLDKINFAQQKNEKSNLLRQINLNYKSLLPLQDNPVTPVILKMNNFEQHRRNGRTWFSYTFFTHPHGYRLVLCVVAAGHDTVAQRDNFVSLFICVMKGQYDDQLTWPMEGVIRVCLLNQLNSTSVEDNDLNYVMMIKLPHAPLFPVNATLRVTTGMKDAASIETPMGLMSTTMLGSNKFVSVEKLTKSSTHQFLKDDCIFFKVEYRKTLEDFASPKSCAYKEPENKTIKHHLHFYRTPQQEMPEEKEPTDFLQNKSVNQNFSGDTGVSKKVEQVPHIPETTTSL